MSIFYSANFKSDKSPCSKALMISDRHQPIVDNKCIRCNKMSSCIINMQH